MVLEWTDDSICVVTRPDGTSYCVGCFLSNGTTHFAASADEMAAHQADHGNVETAAVATAAVVTASAVAVTAAVEQAKAAVKPAPVGVVVGVK